MKITKYLAILLMGGSMVSCGEDFLNDMDSSTVTPDQINDQANKDPDKVLLSQLKGCYTSWNIRTGISSNDINGQMSVGFGGIMTLSDVMSNDISLALGSGDPWYFDHVLDYNAEQYVRARWPWNFFYSLIKSANELIDVVDEDKANETIRHMLGQAYAFRGIGHAYLAQFYQKTYIDSKDLPCVPLRLSKKETSITGRASVEKVYEQIEADLLKAIDYLDGFRRTDKQSINKSVAQGLLSRVYLVMNRWADAAAMAHDARQDYFLNDLQEATEWNYQDVDNHEVMWGFIPTESTTLIFASWASWHSTDGPGYAGVGDGAFQLIDAALYNSIPHNDVRKQLFVAPGQTVPVGKNKIPEYANLKFPFVSQWLGQVVYMRASEMYLNEAEGLLMSGNAPGAADVMKEFMTNRVENWTAPAAWTQADIYNQRRIELWGEGFSYFDHCRLKQDMVRSYEGTNEPLSTQVNIPYSSYLWTYQIPLSEINDNPDINEEDQNPLQ